MVKPKNKHSFSHVRHDPAHCLAPGLFRALKRGERKRGKGGAFLIEANKFKAVFIEAASSGDTLLAPSSANLIESLYLCCSIKIFGDVHRKRNSLGQVVRRHDNPQDYSLPELEPQLHLTRHSLPLSTSSKSTPFHQTENAKTYH